MNNILTAGTDKRGRADIMLAQAIADGVIPDQPTRPAAHVLLGALDEAALYVSRADDAATALTQMFAVCDRVITGIASS